MALIKFLADETTMDLKDGLEGHRVILTSQTPITAIESLVASGFLVLNEYNHSVMADYSGHKYIYYADNEQCQYIITDDPEDVWENAVQVSRASLEEIRNIKISEIESVMNQSISNGVTVSFDDGTVAVFNLSLQDQIMLTALRIVAEQAENKDVRSIPWHTSEQTASNKYFSPSEIVNISNAAIEHIAYHNALFADLRSYINSLLNDEDIWKVNYDLSSLPESARSKVLSDFLNKNK